MLYREDDAYLKFVDGYTHVVVTPEKTDAGDEYYHVWSGSNDLNDLKRKFAHFDNRYLTLEELKSLPVLPRRILHIRDCNWNKDTYMEIMWGGQTTQVTITNDMIHIIGSKWLEVKERGVNSIEIRVKE